MLDIRKITTKSELWTLQPYWNCLLERSKSNGFYLTWEAISTFVEVYGDQNQVMVLVAYEAGRSEPCGIAPLMACSRPGGFSGLARQIRFLGHNNDVMLEYLDFISLSGREEEVVGAFCRYLTGPLRGDWDYLLLGRVLGTSPNIDHLRKELGAAGVDLNCGGKIVCPYLTLPASWDEYYEKQSKKFHKNWHYRQRTLARDGEVRYLFAGTDMPYEQAFDELIRLNRERWGEAGGSFRTEKYVDFHRSLARKCLERRWLLLVLMSVGGKVVSAKYDFAYGGKIYGNQGGWSKEYADKSVGWIMLGKLIEWGIAHGYSEYDFLQGAAAYKSQWSDAERWVSDYEAFNTTVRGRAGRLLRLGYRKLRGRLGR